MLLARARTCHLLPGYGADGLAIPCCSAAIHGHHKHNCMLRMHITHQKQACHSCCRLTIQAAVLVFLPQADVSRVQEQPQGALLL
jgi:hypothetical protein